jgi:hypothetical protein
MQIQCAERGCVVDSERGSRSAVNATAAVRICSIKEFKVYRPDANVEVEGDEGVSHAPLPNGRVEDPTAIFYVVAVVLFILSGIGFKPAG